MMLATPILTLTLALALPQSQGDLDLSSFKFELRETREASREATLAAYGASLQCGEWFVIGPFDAGAPSGSGLEGHHLVHPPERRVDLDASLKGKGGRTIAWRPWPTTGESHAWPVFDLQIFGEPESHRHAMAYLYRRMECAAPCELDFALGSDDGLKLWIDGRLLVDANELRGFDPAQHTVRVKLTAGTHEILAKVTQGEGGWNFQMRPLLDERLLALIEHHLEEHFPSSRERRHYRVFSILEPQGVVLEVGGLDVLPDGRPIVATRRGDVYIVEGAYDEPPSRAEFHRFAFGLHEPLGAMWDGHGLLLAQRGELSRLVDTDGDDRADRFETLTDRWGVSGNYHEFAFGPEQDGNGALWVTLNVGFCGGLGKSIVPWRGWAVRVRDDGTVDPVCGGLRSPNGLGRNAAGEMFCCDNQGDWVGTNKLMHLAPGDWHGHPAGNRWYAEAGMREPEGEVDFKPPAVWFPYDRMGRSASDILLDECGGDFGPFGGQLFVGDQFGALIMRVDLELIGGQWQGACFPFLKGLDSGVNRLAWGPDGSLFVGMTNRGWFSFGNRAWGLQRVVYTGEVPFEILHMRAMSDGFEIEFTKPLAPEGALDESAFAMSCFTHERWERYGSPEIDRRTLTVTSARVSEDGRTVRLVVPNLRERFVHELSIGSAVRSFDGDELLHAQAWYTLNHLPGDPP